MENSNVYILSLEASIIYNHMNRDGYIFEYVDGRMKKRNKYVGMIPYSLELIQLQKQGLKIFNTKRSNKIKTNDIINVKFTNKVNNTEQIINSVLKKNEKDTDETRKEKRLKYIKELETKTNWTEMKNDKLRTELYTKGFTINFDGKKVEYVVYKRSSAKSRNGQVLFIRKQLRDRMIKWARMGMDLYGRTDIDYPSLLAYESLVSSSIEDTIKINPNNILIVDDVKSIFPIDCNVVQKDNDYKLVSEPVEKYMMENDIFDGEGLLDSSYFENRSNKGMMLLRQHLFKSCAFNTNIQEFLKNNCPEDQNYNTWELTNMFNETILAKDVHCIITPASLKALKFSNIKGSKPKMWKHWKKKVEAEDNIFGICKSDEQSKRGIDTEGNILQQTSYQMLNSMPINDKAMEELSQFELGYIEQLKNNDDVYEQYLRESANNMNSNEMLAELYSKNAEIANTKIFKNKRKKDIHNYVRHVKKGKIRLIGDYLTIMGNGIELLYHAIGRLPVDKGALNYEEWKSKMQFKDNEVYTTLCNFDREYVGFRNPHTSPSNVLIVENKDSEFVRKYFNLSNNIIYTNAINFPIQRILSGQDLDSDNLVLFDNSKMLEIAKKCYVMSEKSNYRVCVNNVKQSPNKYTVSPPDMAKIDNILASSNKQIGKIVNLGQHYMSQYWDMINRRNEEIKDEKEDQEIKQLLKGIDVCTVLSEIAIDSAKRMYDLKINKEITSLNNCKILRKDKPLFFKYVIKNKDIEKKTNKYETSMDYLYEILDNIEDADTRKTIKFKTILKDTDLKKVKNRQVEGIFNIIEDMINEIRQIEAINSTKKLSEGEEKEKYNTIDDVIDEYMQKVSRYKIKVETISAIINRVFNGKTKYKYKLDLLDALYRAKKEVFLATFN